MWQAWLTIQMTDRWPFSNRKSEEDNYPIILGFNEIQMKFTHRESVFDDFLRLLRCKYQFCTKIDNSNDRSKTDVIGSMTLSAGSNRFFDFKSVSIVNFRDGIFLTLTSKREEKSRLRTSNVKCVCQRLSNYKRYYCLHVMYVVKF